jgi:hypothetical protein
MVMVAIVQVVVLGSQIKEVVVSFIHLSQV